MILTPEAIDELIPHRAPIRMVGEITEIVIDHCISQNMVTDLWPLCQDGRVPSVMLIELVAQTAAVQIGWEKREEEALGGRGYMVGVKSASWEQEYVAVDDLLIVDLVVIQKRANYAVFRGTVTKSSKIIAQVELQAFRPD